MDKVIEHYKKELSIFERLKWQGYGFFISLLIVSGIAVFDILYSVFKRQVPFWGLMCLLPFIIVVIMTFRIVIVKSNIIAREKFNVIDKDLSKRNKAIDEARVELMKCYLEENNLHSSSKIKLLIDMLNKESDRKKLPKFFVPGIMLVMFLPVWTQFVIIVFKQFQTFEYAFAVTAVLVAVIFVIAYVIGMIKKMVEWISSEFMNNESATIKEVAKLLEEVLLVMADT